MRLGVLFSRRNVIRTQCGQRRSNRVLPLGFRLGLACRLDARSPWLAMLTLPYLIPVTSPPTRRGKAIQAQFGLVRRRFSKRWMDMKGGGPARSF